jgi:hypothetical protein
MIVAMSARVLVSQWIGRTSLLVLWSLAAWGALLLLVTLVDVVGEGLGPPLARLLPGRGASLWAWLNALSVALALAVGLVGGGVAWANRRSARVLPPGPSSDTREVRASSSRHSGE